MSKVTTREQCPACASRGQDSSQDNLAVYDDGHKYCFACEYRENSKGTTMKTSSKPSKFYSGNPVSSRGITEKTMRMYGYETISKDGKRAEIASFYRDGKIIAQHLRGPNKTFRWVGESSAPTLWGQHLWKNTGGKRLVITEGEYDCMTVNQLFNNKWAVVSLPNGAAGAVKAIKDNLEFVSGYDEIVLMFDTDQAGQEAAQSVAEFLPPSKCKIATLPYKDANECLQKNDSQAVITAVWEAQQYSPDEILHVKNIESTVNVNSNVFPFPFNSLTEFLVGQRSGEITLWASGTGSGKTTIIRELIHDHLINGRSVGAIMLEEAPQETMDDMVSLMINKPVRVIRASRMMNELRTKLGQEPINMSIIDDLTDEEYAEARASLDETSFYIYDHLGNNGLKNLCSRMEYMAVSLGVEVIVLDHITAAATGLMGGDKDYEGGSSERLLIDNIMKEFRALVSRTGVRIDVISQLKKTNKAYEEGDRITLQDLRGSGSLSSVPNTVIGLERDRQNPDTMIANTTTIRVLKNRLTGRAGVASCLYYDHANGRLSELDWALDDEGKVLLRS
tara:strand:- start:1627 stop:3315 length:1689 start_codon:yes stop_codon:yes gene_type:complete